MMEATSQSAADSLRAIDPRVRLAADASRRRLLYVFFLWLAGRLLVAAGIVASRVGAFAVMVNWDGGFYRAIATRGYEYGSGSWLHSIAFFPLFPVLSASLMKLGAPFEVAAPLIDNACFLAMLFVVYGWVERRSGVRAAYWTVAFLALCPLSLFATLAYSEGLYLLLTALVLRDFDAGRMREATVWSALASLARPNGVVLLPALLVAAIAGRRGKAAVAPAAAAATGMLVVSAFSWLRFGDPLAFFHAQAGWRPHGYAYGAQQLAVLFASGTVAFGHWILQLVAAATAAALLWQRRRLHWGAAALVWSAVVVVELLCWGRDLSFALLALLGGAALIRYRSVLGTATVCYGLISLVAFVGSATVLSLDRLLYGVLPFSLGVGLVLADLPSIGPSLLAVCAYQLYGASEAFARGRWVA